MAPALVDIHCHAAVNAVRTPSRRSTVSLLSKRVRSAGRRSHANNLIRATPQIDRLQTVRRQADREHRAVGTLTESDYLLGVSDETRLGALRFRWVGDEAFQAPPRNGVPALIELGRLLQSTERILRDAETDEDLQLIFAPGSSLGGAVELAPKHLSSISTAISPSPSSRRRLTITVWRRGRK
jgi:hypothetical protein